MLKKFFRLLSALALGSVGLILLLGIIYLIKPNWIQNGARSIFYPKVNISDTYMNKIVVENPEVYELMHIACGLTNTFQEDANLLRKNTDYYQAVEAWFADHSEHELVNTLEKALRKNDFRWAVGATRVLSMNYDLSEDGQLVTNNLLSTKPLLFKLFKKRTFLMPNHIKVIEDFAQQSNFKQFYKQQKKTRKKLNKQYNKLCNFEDMQAWLEQKFSNKAQSYRIIYSPLTGGFHNTISFEDKNRKATQNLMFVNAPRWNPDTLSAKDLEINSSRQARVVFTEINHNYVNPLTDQYLAELEAAMPDYKRWNDEKQGYKSAYATFNEYMTWGVFSLYAMDTYSAKHIDEIVKVQADFMDDFRGFPRFTTFNKELMRLYKAKNKPPIEELYLPMLEWMKEKVP